MESTHDPAKAPRRASASRSTLAILTDPSQANPFGSIHGGVILRLADECGALAAFRHSGGPMITTAAIDGFTVLGPVRVGERVELVAEVTYAGRTSMEASIDVYAESMTHPNPARKSAPAMASMSRSTRRRAALARSRRSCRRPMPTTPATARPGRGRRPGSPAARPSGNGSTRLSRPACPASAGPRAGASRGPSRSGTRASRTTSAPPAAPSRSCPSSAGCRRTRAAPSARRGPGA